MYMMITMMTTLRIMVRKLYNCMHLLHTSCFICILERGRVSYRQVGNSVFFCHDRNGDETDEPLDNDNKGPIDAFVIIYQSGLARKTSWEAQVEEAVYNETDEFWQQVTNYVHS